MTDQEQSSLKMFLSTARLIADELIQAIPEVEEWFDDISHAIERKTITTSHATQQLRGYFMGLMHTGKIEHADFWGLDKLAADLGLTEL